MDDELRAFLRAHSEQIEAQGQQIKELTSLVRGQRPTHHDGSPLTSVTVKQIYEAFTKAKVDAPSWRITRGRLRAFMVAFADVPAAAITLPMWAAFRQRRKTDDPVLGTKVSPLTINFELDWAKAMFSWASDPEQALLTANPLAKAKRESTDTERETWLTEEDIARLLGVCSPTLVAFVLVAVDTGLRLNEILGIRRDKLRVVETEGGERVALVELSKRATKGKRAHMVALTPRAFAAIEALPDTVNPYVFASTYRPGKAYTDRHMNRLFRGACERAGIDVRAADGDGHIRVHDLRHTAASAATRRGASLRRVQQMLNHSSPSITARYVHHDEDDVVALASLIQKGAENEKRKGPKRAPSPTGDALASAPNTEKK